MAYVTLDGGGNITGQFARPQPGVPGYAQIADNDPRIAAFTSAQLAQASQLTPVKSVAGTFANVPASPVEGMLLGISDSTTNVWGDTIKGGGAFHVLGYYNGTNWTVAAK
jgi:hypothetical protein